MSWYSDDYPDPIVKKLASKQEKKIQLSIK